VTSENYKPKYITSIDQVEGLSTEEKDQLRPITEKFVFRTNDYYQSLIDWNDPNDPIRRIIMPEVDELDEFGEWDACDEASYTVTRGLEHKYPDTALLLVNAVCGAYCRFCFRKRLFTAENDEVTNDVTDGVRYISEHPEINNVLLTGGDPLIMSTEKLAKIIRSVRQVDHVKIIRIGTKMVAFNPHRIINDPSLMELIEENSQAGKRIFIMGHFNHPREITDVAIQGIRLLQKAGATVVNQSPMIRGVNDHPEILTQLFNKLSFNGVVPYYIFMCRPTAGNKPFLVPVEEALDIFERSRIRLSGLAKHARLCMSHKTGKIEVIGKMGKDVLFRYHRAANPMNYGRIKAYPSDPAACWFDDYVNGPREAGEMVAKSSYAAG